MTEVDHSLFASWPAGGGEPRRLVAEETECRRRLARFRATAENEVVDALHDVLAIRFGEEPGRECLGAREGP
jgi:hypothetical protein